MNSLKIVKLQSENIKRLKAIEIVPVGNTVVVSGKNDQGKSSCLDSIEYALGGRQSICEEPIRKGQQKARIVCDLGEIVVERKFSASTGESTITVRGKGGAPVKRPQELLDSLCSHVAFDPLSFVRMKAQEQWEALSKLVGLDFTDLNTKRQVAYDERTIAGRQLDAAKARIPEFPFYADAPDKEINVSECQVKLEKIKAQREANATVRSAVARAKLMLDSLENTIKRSADRETELLAQLKDVQEAKAKHIAGLAKAKSDLADSELAASKLAEDDEQQVLTELANLNSINSKVQANVRHTKANEEIQRHQFTVDKLTHEIESVDQEKTDRLAWTEFPLPGLSLDDNRVLLNGVPFTQASQARQLQAAVAIGLALNPKVRVILCRDASLLDDDSMKLMAELAVTRDAQIWMEVVSSKDPSAVVIEDGEVKP